MIVATEIELLVSGPTYPPGVIAHKPPTTIGGLGRSTTPPLANLEADGSNFATSGAAISALSAPHKNDLLFT